MTDDRVLPIHVPEKLTTAEAAEMIAVLLHHGYLYPLGGDSLVYSHENPEIQIEVADAVGWIENNEAARAAGQGWQDPMDVHTWFSLTYAAYLVWPRAIMQAMPIDWQYRFVALARQLEDAAHDLGPMAYSVQMRDGKGRFIKDPLANYRYPQVELDLDKPAM